MTKADRIIEYLARVQRSTSPVIARALGYELAFVTTALRRRGAHVCGWQYTGARPCAIWDLAGGPDVRAPKGEGPPAAPPPIGLSMFEQLNRSLENQHA